MFAVFGLGATEVIVLLAIGLVLFGNRLPDLARTLGRSFMEVKKELNGIQDDVNRTLK
jgi:sec-independent protein translocase protein TatA